MNGYRLCIVTDMESSGSTVNRSRRTEWHGFYTVAKFQLDSGYFTIATIGSASMQSIYISETPSKIHATERSVFATDVASFPLMQLVKFVGCIKRLIITRRNLGGCLVWIKPTYPILSVELNVS